MIYTQKNGERRPGVAGGGGGKGRDLDLHAACLVNNCQGKYIT